MFVLLRVLPGHAWGSVLLPAWNRSEAETELQSESPVELEGAARLSHWSAVGQIPSQHMQRDGQCLEEECSSAFSSSKGLRQLIPTSVVVGAAAAAASGGRARSSALGVSVGGVGDLTQVHAASATMTTTVRTSRAPVRRPGAAMQRS